MKIPKIIHYVWFGKTKKNDLFYKCLESWKKFCPDYEIKEWNEDNIDFSENEYTKQAYELKKFGFTGDYLRAKILYEFGGIYLDTDVEITKSFDDLLDNDFVMGFENNTYCATAILASIPKHEYLKTICNFYQKKQFINDKKQIDNTPSPAFWTYFLKRDYGLKLNNKYQLLNSKNKNDNAKMAIYPKDYFSPLNYTTKKLKVTNNTYTFIILMLLGLQIK